MELNRAHLRRPFSTLRRGTAALWCAAVLLAAGCSPSSGTAQDAAPGDSAATSTPPPPPVREAVPPAAVLDTIAARAETLEPLTSLLVSFRDSLVLEVYYNGLDRDDRVNLKSASKSLLSALVGVAIRDSLIEGVDQPVAELLPRYFDADMDSVKRSMTLHQLLSMTTGLEGTSFDTYGAWVSSRDWVQFALDRPMACPPGSCMTYSTGNTHLVSAILTRVSGRNTRAYFQEALFDEMGIFLPGWDRDPQGIYLGGNNMALRPIDMLAVGQLYLNRGRWNGKQLIPEDWIDASWGHYAWSRWNGHRYGYFWWGREFGGETVHFAWGYGGQFIFVVPRLELVVAASSSLQNRRRGGDHNWAVYRFLGNVVFPAFYEPELGGDTAG